MPRVTLLVATCNRASLLPAALDSLLGQTRPPDQVLVVDDGSIDDTPSVLADYGARVESLRVANGGKSRALNRALPKVTGDLLWIFDDDDVALPDALERQLDFLADRPDVDVTYSGWIVEERDGRRREVRARDDGQVFYDLLDGCFLQVQGMLVRTRCYRQVGAFDEDLLRSGDYEMNLRLCRRFRTARLPGGPTFVYRQHGGGRGLASVAFSPREMDAWWLHFDRRIVGRLLSELALWECLPGGRPGVELSASEHRHAHLKRLCVAVRRGLWNLGLEDLAAAVEADPHRPLDAGEEALWRLAFDPVYGQNPGLGALLAEPELRRAVARRCRGVAGRRLGRLLGMRLARAARWLAEQRRP